MNFEQFAEDAVKAALKSGADEADVFVQSGRESEVSTRMSRIENIKQATSEGYGVRVFKGGRLGFCFSSDFTGSSMKDTAARVATLAQETSIDEFNGLPESVDEQPGLDLKIHDPEIEKIPVDNKIDACMTMEQAMMNYDERVVNSEGAGFYDGETITAIASSRGLSKSFKSSYCYMICKPVAAEDGKMQAGWWFSFKRFYADLEIPENVGKIAAERAVRMLGARKPPSAKIPVVFDNITGTSILGCILSAVNGDAVYKNATYLAGKLGQEIASPLVSVVDDGVMRRGLASAPFDGEGLSTLRREIISSGALRSYMYDTYTARKAGTVTTANAQRDQASLPSIGPFNFHMKAGISEFEEIIRSVRSGLYLTGLMGFGANPVTGDYSLGASGIWIENGELAYPVEGITVAANMLDMLKNIDMVGNDLQFTGPVSCPTFRVSEMTVSGSM
jgi:PmbA protein